MDGHEKIIKDAIRDTRKYQDPLIEERVREHQKLGNNKEAQDLLDLLISLKDKNGEPLLSLEEIKAQVNVSVSLSLSLFLFLHTTKLK